MDDDLTEWVNQWKWCRGGWEKRYVRRRDREQGDVFLHRAVLGLSRGDGTTVDHINRNTLDCRRGNLRLVPGDAGNLQNVPARGGSSRFRGVSYDRNRGLWQARLTLLGRTVHLGRFVTELEAARAAEAGRAEHMPYALPDPALAEVA